MAAYGLEPQRADAATLAAAYEPRSNLFEGHVAIYLHALSDLSCPRIRALHNGGELCLDRAKLCKIPQWHVYAQFSFAEGLIETDFVLFLFLFFFLTVSKM